MEQIILYYNPNCPDCVRQAKRTAQMDWLGRVELSTQESPLGKVPVGEILVVDKQSHQAWAYTYNALMNVESRL